ncbi:Contains similarity to protein-tyrosine phosphatase 2 gb/L15420 from Dictyostelium discoideum. EST gb/N38718 comes from this g [Arabidopsis thaliana]|nr:Contains similarity to protein-tyrosine phosphatase 2 gb/L15420 from Dictyostelium discoideum. EST gb/N38718 comes from this g [Arabidopsis thaliana]
MTKRKKEVIDVDCSEKKDFVIDWSSAMDKEDEVPELEIVNTTKPTPPPPPTFFSDDQTDSPKLLTDRDLDEQLERKKAILTLGPGLPDKGEKIRLKIADLEEEKQRSDVLPQGNAVSKDTSRGNADSKDTSRQGNADSKEVSRSTFSAVFSKPKTDSQSKKAFGKELEDLGCERRKHKAGRKPVTRLSNGWRLLPDVGKAEHSAKQFDSGLKESKGNKKSKEPYGKKRPMESSTYSLIDDDDDDDDDDDNDTSGHETPREWSWEKSPSQSSRRRKKSEDTVINVDEEEAQPSTVAEQAAELPEGLIKLQLAIYKLIVDKTCSLQEDICYPTRFLQQQISSSNQISADCHFFNTYFYKKLSDAVTYKGNDKDAFFVRFRRWWKGIDLFRKAYIFIPIHEDLHWSLVIVCIPDKKDESGLTILHLDSLGLHSRKSIVENVKRFLKDEWNYLNQDDYSLDLPISEKVWKNLPRRISEAVVQVPQQKNDFDCGPFVLFFIKRFIEEAPQRLKRKDLGMFDKKWFRPDEASALRIKIRNTLIELFRVSDQTE